MSLTSLINSEKNQVKICQLILNQQRKWLNVQPLRIFLQNNLKGISGISETESKSEEVTI